VTGETDGIRERIREIAERARKAAEAAAEREPAPAPAEPPPRHWQEAAEDRGDDEPSRLELEAGDVAARDTACARLRALLADGGWHSALELVDVGGLRYGGRLHEIRRGLDGAPALDVEGEAREHRGRSVWWYRAARARSAP
jgi:hypothetical protein